MAGPITGRVGRRTTGPPITDPGWRRPAPPRFCISSRIPRPGMGAPQLVAAGFGARIALSACLAWALATARRTARGRTAAALATSGFGAVTDIAAVGDRVALARARTSWYAARTRSSNRRHR